MSKGNGEVMSVKILRTAAAAPGAGWTREVIFGAASGPLRGLRLLGFAV